MKQEKCKIQAYVVKDVYDYVQSEAQRYGLSISAYFTMIIQQQRMQGDALNAIARMEELSRKMELANVE